MMGSHKQRFLLLALFLILCLSGQRAPGVEARLQRHRLNYGPKKLFVFGDSYVGTGNDRKSQSHCWNDPYGITFPGKPAGRFSDGRLLTDYVAKSLRVKSPLPYRFRKLFPQNLKYGMNFAFAGTGVFETSAPGPNITGQIDLLQQVIKDKVYTASDLSNSVALISVAGNDYIHYWSTSGSAQDLPSFVASVVNQTATDMIRIKGLGVKKVVVGDLQPLGCLPQFTAATSFKQCNTSTNNVVLLHNHLLSQSVTRLNQKTKEGRSTFVILNLYDSFMSVLNHPSTYNIQPQLKPCCFGVSSGYVCGDVDENKVKKYGVCDDPKSAFFWDQVHPTQIGWEAVYNELRTTNALQQVHY